MKKVLITSKEGQVTSRAELQQLRNGPGVQNLQVSLKQLQENLLFTKEKENSVSQECTEENISAKAVLNVPVLNKYLVAFTERFP